MRKNIVALSLVLPLLFLFSVFSAAKTVTLGIQVSACGIELVGAPQNGYRIDLSEKEEEIVLKANVLPEAASDRGYFYRVTGDAVTVDEKGRLHAVKTGEATVSAVSRDGGFEDSVKVAVYASRPYDFTFSLRGGDGRELLEETERGYTATLPTGTYSYTARAIPGGETPAISSSGYAFLDRAAGALFLPFSGEHTLALSLKGKWRGKELSVEKQATLFAERFVTQSGFVINGGNPTLAAERGNTEISFFIEGDVPPSIEQNAAISASRVEQIGENRYRAIVTLGEEREDFSFFVTDASGERREEGFVTFSDFDFTVRPDLPVLTDRPSILLDEPVAFYAVPAVPAEGISYTWEIEGDAELRPGDGMCYVTARHAGNLALRVCASRKGEPLTEKRVEIDAVRRVRTVQFADRTDLGLARNLTVAGLRYRGETLVRNEVPLRLVLSDGKNELAGTEDIAFSVSDGTRALVETGDGTPRLIPGESGHVTVTAEWRGNGSYGESVRGVFEAYIAGDGVEAGTSGQLYRAAGEGRKIVLANDILLGTDDAGMPLPPEARGRLLSEMLSTYNTEYYRNASGESVENAVVRYALEFKNDVYGNGHSLNAELFSADKDGAAPRFFRGPLCFVKFGQLASVAAQDNISFLVRTGGVTLHNLSLLGCGDGVLQTENGYDLSKLNTVGTVLELNADARLINCRVRNGRTVVRAYGGNREGNRYFSPRSAEEERIHVRIEGCHLAQGREFLLKIGANAAVKATAADREPDLPAYPFGKDYADDENFYRDCVFTDVTVKDSVLETSGLFCVGAESNFSGTLLSEGGSGGAFDGWAGTGGTSYASILRFEGEVRLYDWKDVSLIDSSSLIETELKELKLDLAAMLSFVAARDPEQYGELLEKSGGREYVHGGVAFYGGGKNYSVFQDASSRPDLREYRANISVLGEAEGSTGYQGQILPAAAGTQDFRFYLYGANGGSGRAAQLREGEEGRKYEKIAPFPPF